MNKTLERAQEDGIQTFSITAAIGATAMLLKNWFPDLPWEDINNWLLIVAAPLIATLSAAWTAKRHVDKTK